MAQLDPSSPALTSTEIVAYRADVYRIALTLIKSPDWPRGYEPEDVVSLASFLMGE
jgi:hypothetical protein